MRALRSVSRVGGSSPFPRIAEVVFFIVFDIDIFIAIGVTTLSTRSREEALFALALATFAGRVVRIVEVTQVAFDLSQATRNAAAAESAAIVN